MEITANAVQTVTANGLITFTDVTVPGSPSILHRDGSGLVTLRGLTRQPRARFKVSFNGNVAAAATATAISTAIILNGEALPEATMTITPAATGAYSNISASVYIDVPAGCCSRVGVMNVSTQSITTMNANLLIERIA